MPKHRDGLSHRQKVFVNEYLKCFNAREAARRAGLSEDYTGQLMQLPIIKDTIEKRLEAMHMSANEALRLQADIARGDIGDFLAISPDGFTIDLSMAKELGLTRLIKRIKKKHTKYSGQKNDSEITIEDIELYPADVAQERILKVHGRLREGDKPPTNPNAGKYFLPAEIIAPSFFDVHRDIIHKAHTEYVLFGGRGSTKSSFVSVEIISLLKNDPTMHALALRQVANTLRDSVYAQFKWAIDELGLGEEFKCTTNPMEIELIATGQKIYFRGADDPMKIKSIRPPFGAIKVLWFEETSEFAGDAALRNITQSAIRGTDLAYIFKTYNPPRTSGNWINKYIQIPKESQFQHKSSYLGVPAEWLGKVFIDEAEHLKSVNPDAYAHEYLGEVNGLGDQVFNNLQIRQITDEEIYGKPDGFGGMEGGFDNILHGLDFGFYPHPAHYARVHYDATRLTLYVFGEVRKWKTANREMYNTLVEYGLTPNDMLICDSAEPKSVADYRDYGANAKGAEKGPESVRYSMKWLQSLKAIVIDPVRAPYTAEEMTDYAYERTKDGDIIEAFPNEKDDAIAAIRYATNLVWRKRGQ